MKEYVLSEKAQKRLGEILLMHFWVYDHQFKVDDYYDLGITCEICRKKTDNKYYLLDLNDFGMIGICIECFKKEIKVIESVDE